VKKAASQISSRGFALAAKAQVALSWRGDVSPRALAAFVKRPQAALLKSAHVYSIELMKQPVKRMFLLFLGIIAE
jgi:hypothetical protein